MKRGITVAIEDGVVARLRAIRDKTGEPLGCQLERAVLALWGRDAEQQPEQKEAQK